jgi:molybdenum cofactor synthesis domain-containing protein
MQEIIKASVLIIGDEILSGSTQDQNIQYIANNLSDLGIVFAEARIVRDVEEDIIFALNELRSKYDYVFTTGGIGPTHDDITAASVAKAFNVKLERNVQAVKLMEARYLEMGKIMHSASYKMAEMPVGAELILNPVSGAPGFRIENVYVMAGIPNIMRSMFDNIKNKLRVGNRFVTKKLKLNVGESQISKLLEKLNLEYSELSMGSYPFQNDAKWGTNLVIRGNNKNLVEEAFTKLKDYLKLENIEFTNESLG